MKKPILLATYILLALSLSALAGWHTNAPFVAWPATNHLRWTTNVGTYTNESDWQGTNGYGGWTNNYVTNSLWRGSNVWYVYLGTKKVAAISPHYFYNAFDFMPKGSWENFFLQAKDVRALDVDSAMMERWLVLSTNNTISNYFGAVDTHTPDHG